MKNCEKFLDVVEKWQQNQWLQMEMCRYELHRIHCTLKNLMNYCQELARILLRVNTVDCTDAKEKHAMIGKVQWRYLLDSDYLWKVEAGEALLERHLENIFWNWDAARRHCRQRGKNKGNRSSEEILEEIVKMKKEVQEKIVDTTMSLERLEDLTRDKGEQIKSLRQQINKFEEAQQLTGRNKVSPSSNIQPVSFEVGTECTNMTCTNSVNGKMNKT